MAVSAGNTIRPGEEETWETAKAIADKLKPLPIAFTSSVRLLMTDHLNNEGKLRPVTKLQTARLFRSKSFRTMLYQVTLDLHSQELATASRVSVGKLMNNYTAGDLAALIGMFVYFKKVRRLVGEAEWGLLRNDVIMRLQAGAAAGVAVPKIGVATGLLAGAMPVLSVCSLRPFNESGFTEYRRSLQKNDLQFDPEMEIMHWGCTASQVASLSLSALGFGVELAESLMTGTAKGADFSRLRTERHKDFFMARLWMDTFLNHKEQPDMQIPGEYFPMESEKEKAKHAMSCLMDGYKHWFEYSQDDVSPELEQKLFPAIDPDSEVPADLQEIFSLEEICEMEEEDFDDLIDQIDMEQAGEVAMGGTSFKASDLDNLDDAIS